MNPPRRLRGTFGMCNLREGFVVAPWRLREAFSKTRSAKASRSPLEGFAKASRRRHGRLHLETIRQIMTSPHIFIAKLRVAQVQYYSYTLLSGGCPSRTVLTWAFVTWETVVRRACQPSCARLRIETFVDISAGARCSPVTLVDLQFLHCGIAPFTRGVLHSRL